MIPFQKTLILLRHAHRDLSDREQDNGLSSKGRQQAKKLSKTLISILPKGPILVFSSPKRRCIETLDPLLSSLKVKARVDEALLECQPAEVGVHFEQRISGWYDAWLRSSVEATLVCSHSDWLSAALFLILGVQSEFKKGGWAELMVKNGDPALLFRCL